MWQKKRGAEAIAQIFNVDNRMQEIFNPPSIAVFNLIDKDTGKVKENAQGQFLNELPRKVMFLEREYDRYQRLVATVEPDKPFEK